MNIVRVTVAYLNACMNVKPKMQNQRLKLKCLGKSGETCGLTGKGPGLTCQDSAGRAFGWVMLAP
jgi:hypothetical protein